MKKLIFFRQSLSPCPYLEGIKDALCYKFRRPMISQNSSVVCTNGQYANHKKNNSVHCVYTISAERELGVMEFGAAWLSLWSTLLPSGAHRVGSRPQAHLPPHHHIISGQWQLYCGVYPFSLTVYKTSFS